MILREVRGREPQIVDRLNEMFTAAKAGLEGGGELSRRKMWERCFYAYQSRNAPDYGPGEGRSNIYLPFPYNATHSILAELKNNLIPFPGFFKCSSEDADGETTAELVEAELRYLLRQMKFEQAIRPLLLQAIVYGTSPYLLTWEERYRLTTVDIEGVDEGNPIDGEAGRGGLRPVREPRLIYNGPALYPLDIFSVYYDPAPTADARPDSVWRIVKSRETPAGLKRKARERVGGYRLYEDLDQIKPGGELPDANEVSRALAFGLAVPAQGKHDVSLKTFYGDLSIEIEGEEQVFENVIAVWANDETLIRFEDNDTPGGHIPVQQITYEESGLPGAVLGLGALEPCLGIGGAANASVNLWNDGMSKLMKQPKFYDPTDRHFDPDKISHQDEYIPASKPIVAVPQNFSLYQAQEVVGFWELMYNRASGAPQTHSMVETPRTATEIARIAAASSARFKELVAHLSTQVDYLLEMLIDWRREYGEPGLFVRQVPDPQTGALVEVAIPDEIFDKEYSVHCIGGGIMAEKAAQLAGISQFLQGLKILGPLDPVLLADVNTELILRRLWGAGAGYDEDEIIQVNPVRRALINAKANGQGAGGPGAGADAEDAAGIASLAAGGGAGAGTPSGPQGGGFPA